MPSPSVLLVAVALLAANLVPLAAPAAMEPTGAFATAIPLTVTPYHGLEPRLALAYSSHRGNGPLGVGWALEGLSEVRRVSASRGVARHDTTDRFYLEGGELLACPADPADSLARRPSCEYPSSAAHRAYAMRIETFERIAFDPAPAGGAWYVWDRLGTKRTYRPSASGASWPLANVEDVLGNRVDYFYRTPRGPTTTPDTIDRIAYNGTTVRFVWQGGRPDRVSASNGKSVQTIGERLAAIEITVGAARSRAYALTYEQHAGTGASILAEVREYGTDASIDSTGRVTGTSNLPVTLRYQQGTGDGLLQATAWKGTTPPGRDGVPRRPTFPGTYEPMVRSFAEKNNPYGFGESFYSGDFDGDGRTDGVLATVTDISLPQARLTLSVFAASGTQVATGLSFAPAGRWYPSGRPDDDRRGDLVRAFPADVDGDGRHDLILMAWRDIDPSNPLGALELMLNVALADGHGGFRWATPAFQGTGWISVNLTQVRGPQCVAADFNGDRRADFACIVQDSDGKQSIAEALAQSGGSFQIGTLPPMPIADYPWPIIAGQTFPAETRALAAGDTNGDGLDEVLILDLRPEDVAACAPQDLATCTIRYDVVTGAWNGAGFDLVRTQTPWQRIFGEKTSRALYAADLNADGRVDFLTIPGIAQGQRFQTLRSLDAAIVQGNGGLTFVTQAVPVALSTQQVSLTLGDANGDGMTDILAAALLPPGSWQPLYSSADGLRSLAVDRNQDGRLEVFGVAPDNTIWHTWQEGSCGWPRNYERPMLSEVSSRGNGTFRPPLALGRLPVRTRDTPAVERSAEHARRLPCG